MSKHSSVTCEDNAASGMVISTGSSRIAQQLGLEASKFWTEVAMCGQHSMESNGVIHIRTSNPWLASESEADDLFNKLAQELASFNVLIIADLYRRSLHSNTGLACMDSLAWSKSVLTPLRHLFLLSQRAINEFLSINTAGKIVVLADATATLGGIDRIVETALYSLIRSMTKEYGRRNINCNAVISQLSDSPASLSPKQIDHKMIDVALFLASSAASYINGEMVYVS